MVNAMKNLSPDDNNLPAMVADAYRHFSDEMPIIPLVQSPMIIPFNTTYWTGWPTKGGEAIPMHAWGQTHRLIYQLEHAN